MSVTTGSITPNLSFQGSSVKSGGNTNINHTNYINITTQESEGNPFEILDKNTVLDALYDSDARYDPPKCHPDTRKAVLNHIRSWATSEESRPVMWIRGGAGAGKSAISQTLSEGWAKERLLAASFYFFRTASGRNEKKYFIATLAYQMTGFIPGYRRMIEDAIRRTPRIFERNLRRQTQELIIDPLMALSRSATIGARLVVIDGLDECCHSYPDQDFEKQQKEILEAIFLASSEKGFPLRFLIASRPERKIREIFDHGFLEPVSSCTVLDDTQNPSADIELYLQCSLAEIRKIHSHLGPLWPPEAVIKQLVAKSSGHFIYAAVVVRYLSSPRTDPDAGLTAIMNIGHSSVDQPFAELDALYTHILESVVPQSLSTIMEIFGLMIYLDNDLRFLDMDITKMSPFFIAKFLFISPGQLSIHLVDLHSILDIPSAAASRSAPISFLHASFSEFLTQSSRSHRFFIDEGRASSRILSISIRHLSIQLLSLDNGKKDEYYINGFALQVGYALEQIEPDNNDLEALRAIFSQDENDFVQFVHKAGLNQFGTTRRSMEQIRWLYAESNDDRPSRPHVLVALKRHPVQGFLPIDPARDDMLPEVFAGALEWFCDANQACASSVVHNRNSDNIKQGTGSTHHPSEVSHLLDVHPIKSSGEHDDILPGSQGESENPQRRRSKRRLTTPNSQISSPPPKPKKGRRRR